MNEKEKHILRRKQGGCSLGFQFGLLRFGFPVPFGSWASESFQVAQLAKALNLGGPDSREKFNELYVCSVSLGNNTHKNAPKTMI